MKTPLDGPLVCPVRLPTASDDYAAARAACRFDAGTRAPETLGISPDLVRTIPIRHVLVVMRENRSFDHLFGALHDAGQAGVEPLPTSFQNSDLYGRPVTFHHADTTCIHSNPDHQWSAMHQDEADGTMSGFVVSAARSTGTDGSFVMSYYEPRDLPFNYWLANTYAIGDRHFASGETGTYPNRDFLLFGRSAGLQTGSNAVASPELPSLFRTLIDAGFTWGAYSDGKPFSGALHWDHDDPGVHRLSTLFEQLDRGTLPNVAFVDGIARVDDDHPTADLQAGERWLRQLYQHAVESPQWPRLALVWTYDEGGGFADHVPPPSACAPGTTGLDRDFTQLGPRVPLVVISPYAKPHYVSHVVEDHTAITRFIEAIFGLPALSKRDANSPALLDLFEFSCVPALLQPPPAPAAGVNGCL